MDIKEANMLEILFILEKNKALAKKGEVPEKFAIIVENAYSELKERYCKNNLQESNSEKLTKEKLHNYAKDEARYDLLNALIDFAIKRLPFNGDKNDQNTENKDLFINENIKPLINIMSEQYKFSVSNITDANCNLTKLTEQEHERLMTELLIELDPTLEWLEIYQEAKKEGKIINLEKNNEQKRQELAKKFAMDELKYGWKVICGKDNVSYIITEKTNTIDDIPNEIHEFVHYVAWYKQLTINFQNTLVEYPSIFYELYAQHFLKRHGFPSEELKKISRTRSIDTAANVIYCEELFEFIEIFISGQRITEELLVEQAKEAIDDILTTVPKEFQEMVFKRLPDLLDPKKSAINVCDSSIKKLVDNPYEIYTLYPYIIGDYLAVKTMEKQEKDPTILSQVKYYTENLATINPYDVFERMDSDVKKWHLTRIPLSQENAKQKIISNKKNK